MSAPPPAEEWMCDYRYTTPCNICGEVTKWDDTYPEGRVWYCGGCDALISWED